MCGAQMLVAFIMIPILSACAFPAQRHVVQGQRCPSAQSDEATSLFLLGFCGVAGQLTACFWCIMLAVSFRVAPRHPRVVFQVTRKHDVLQIGGLLFILLLRSSSRMKWSVRQSFAHSPGNLNMHLFGARVS